MTALLDAVGRGITDTGLDLAALSEDERPGTVVFAVVTDGGENSSKEWTQQALQEKIAEQRDAYGWMFVFIGADEHAWQGANLGMASASFDSSQQDAYLRTYSGLSQSISSSRAAAASGVRQEVSVEDVK